jgi:hypothetical protein
MRRTVLLGLALVLIAWGGAQAQEGVGAGATFKFGVDARALAMGGAFVAVANGYSAPYWNPAGLAMAVGTHIGGMNTNKFGLGINFNYIGAALELAGFRVGGAFLGSTISGIETFGPGGESTGTVDDNELLFLGSTAFTLPLGEIPLVVGANAKYYSHSLAGESGTGFGGDVGLMLAMGNLLLGAAATDLGGTNITWSTSAVDKVDMGIRVGAALSLEAPVLWTASAQYDADTQMIHLGAEFRLTQQIALRVGAQRPMDGDFSFTAGAGLSLGAFSVDAAFVQNQLLGNSLVVSGEFVF